MQISMNPLPLSKVIMIRRYAVKGVYVMSATRRALSQNGNKTHGLMTCDHGNIVFTTTVDENLSDVSQAEIMVQGKLFPLCNFLLMKLPQVT